VEKILNKIKSWANTLKQNIKALSIAIKDKSINWKTRALIYFTLGYALSPIDLIPDFIPVLGYLDDIIILPALIYFIIKSIPKEKFQTYIDKAESSHIILKKSYIAACVIIFIWICSLLLFIKAI
jgi:uncharacterized membrane protein YkvA (DUF1232 family)